MIKSLISRSWRGFVARTGGSELSQLTRGSYMCVRLLWPQIKGKLYLSSLFIIVRADTILTKLELLHLEKSSELIRISGLDDEVTELISCDLRWWFRWASLRPFVLAPSVQLFLSAPYYPGRAPSVPYLTIRSRFYERYYLGIIRVAHNTITDMGQTLPQSRRVERRSVDAADSVRGGPVVTGRRMESTRARLFRLAHLPKATVFVGWHALVNLFLVCKRYVQCSLHVLKWSRLSGSGWKRGS